MKVVPTFLMIPVTRRSYEVNDMDGTAIEAVRRQKNLSQGWRRLLDPRNLRIADPWVDMTE